MPLRVSNRIAQLKPSATIAVAQKARELKAEGRDIISLGFGEPDFDTPDHIKAAAIAAIEAGDTKYPPVDGTVALKQAIVDKFRRDNDLDFELGEIIVGTGAKQVLYNLMVATLNDNDEVLIPAPYWVSYPDMVKMAGGAPVIINTTDEGGFKITPRLLRSALNDRSRMLLLNAPSNPTGRVYSNEEFQALGEVLKDFPKVVVVTDDIYEHIYWADTPFRTLLNACPELKGRTVVVNGVSKAYAMTGWRIGYAGGPAPLIQAMKKVQGQSTSGACSIAQAAAAAALDGPQDCVAAMRDEFKQRYEYLVPALNALDGVECPECEGAFYAFPSFEGVIERLPDIKDDVELAAWFLDKAGVAMVPGTAFGAPGHIRLSFATSMDNLRECVARIKRAIEEA
jgi:aspartate aminotransferase